jgi:nucleoside-diphosphate-sugar epimerase
LVESFRDAGWRVRAIVRPGNQKPVPPGADALACPLEPEPLTRAVDGSALIVHAAGVIRARTAAGFDAVNVAGTRAAVASANAAGSRFILISSLAAAGIGTIEHPVREEDPPSPINVYGRSKLAAEALVQNDARVPWTIIRPSAVYGPRDRGFLPLFRLAARGLSLLVTNPAAAYTLIHVDDVSRAVQMAAAHDRVDREILFVGHPTPVGAADVLGEIARAMGRPYRPIRIPRAVTAVAARAGDLAWAAGVVPLIDTARLTELGAEGFVCSVKRAADVLGFRAAVDWPAGADRTARWYREQRWV